MYDHENINENETCNKARYVVLITEDVSIERKDALDLETGKSIDNE